MDIKFSYTILFTFLLSCKTDKVSVNDPPIEKLSNGLYYRNDLFVLIENNQAFPESFVKVARKVGLREAFTDTLVKQNDSLFIGNKFSIYLHRNRIFFDAKNNPKDQYPIRLQIANEKIRKRWDDWHYQLRQK